MTDDHCARNNTGTRGEGRSDAFPERLRDLVGTSSLRAFARKAGVSDTFLRQCLSGRTEPTRTKLIALARAGGATVEWLATGGGGRSETSANDSAVSGRASLIDRPRLEAVIASIEEVLGDSARTLTPDRKALLIMTLYERHDGARDRPPLSRSDLLALLTPGP